VHLILVVYRCLAVVLYSTPGCGAGIPCLAVVLADHAWLWCWHTMPGRGAGRPCLAVVLERKSGVSGKSVELGGSRSMKK